LEALAARPGLTVAGVDLRRSVAGMWYCFEASAPGFTYFETATAQLFADAIARRLVAGSASR